MQDNITGSIKSSLQEIRSDLKEELQQLKYQLRLLEDKVIERMGQSKDEQKPATGVNDSPMEEGKDKSKVHTVEKSYI